MFHTRWVEENYNYRSPSPADSLWLSKCAQCNGLFGVQSERKWAGVDRRGGSVAIAKDLSLAHSVCAGDELKHINPLLIYCRLQGLRRIYGGCRPGAFSS